MSCQWHRYTLNLLVSVLCIDEAILLLFDLLSTPYSISALISTLQRSNILFIIRYSTCISVWHHARLNESVSLSLFLR